MSDVDLAVFLERAPSLAPGVDITSLRLNVEEGFLLSRIDGRTSAATLCDMVNATPEKVAGTLRRLEKMKAVEWLGAEGAALDKAGLFFDESDLNDEERAALTEPGDLKHNERLRILAVERLLANGTYWEVLGVSGRPSTSEIKRAYFKASKEFHPDRYFGKKLGSFGKKLEKIFNGMRKAYEVLANEQLRGAYAKKFPPP